MSTVSLMQCTLKLLHAYEGSMLTLAEEIKVRNPETKISFYWLRKFSSGNFSDPSVNRVQELYEYLTGEPLLTVDI